MVAEAEEIIVSLISTAVWSKLCDERTDFHLTDLSLFLFIVIISLVVKADFTLKCYVVKFGKFQNCDNWTVISNKIRDKWI